MNETEPPERPRVVTILCWVTLVFATGFVVFGGIMASQMMLRPAIFIGFLPGILAGAGAIGLLLEKDWSERLLKPGLLIGAFGSMAVAIFSALMIGEGSSLAVVATVVSVLVSIVMLGLAFGLGSTVVNDYIMSLRMSQMDGPTSVESRTVLDFSDGGWEGIEDDDLAEEDDGELDESSPAEERVAVEEPVGK